MAGRHDDVLAALSFYRAVIDGDEATQRQVTAETEAGDLPRGLLTLLGSVITSLATVWGISHDELVETLRAQYLVTDMLLAVEP